MSWPAELEERARRLGVRLPDEDAVAAKVTEQRRLFEEENRRITERAVKGAKRG